MASRWISHEAGPMLEYHGQMVSLLAKRVLKRASTCNLTLMKPPVAAPLPLRGFIMEPSRNNVRRFRVAKKLSKSELARRAGISPLTVDRAEKGMPVRIATRRKILLGLGLKFSQRRRVLREN